MKNRISQRNKTISWCRKTVSEVSNFLSVFKCRVSSLEMASLTGFSEDHVNVIYILS